jgi:hypothetical protein
VLEVMVCGSSIPSIPLGESGCCEHHDDVDRAKEMEEQGPGLGYHVSIILGNELYAPGGRMGWYAVDIATEFYLGNTSENGVPWSCSFSIIIIE